MSNVKQTLPVSSKCNQLNWPDDAAPIGHQIDEDGYAVIRNFVPLEQLREAKNLAENAVKNAGGEYVVMEGADALAGTFLKDLGTDPRFIAICNELYRHASGDRSPETDFYQILRCLAGRSARSHSLRFHYDSYLVSALIPIIIPREGNPGDLIIARQKRNVRKFYATNLMDKILTDNPASQMVMRRLAARGERYFKRIHLTPGDLYLFWGYRSLHTNEPCDEGNIRSTAILHYANPHADSRLRKTLRSKRAD